MDNIKIYTDINQIVSNIQPQITLAIQNTLKDEALEYYATLTENEKRIKLAQYKQKFANYMNLLENNTSVALYLEAYEFVLEFRKFILGTLGTINYSFVLGYKPINSNSQVFMKTITLGQVDFLQLLKDKNGDIVGLKNDSGRLRFTSSFLQNLRRLIREIQEKGVKIEINPSCSSFSLINEDLGTRQNFSNGNLFKARINFLQRQYKAQTFYNFQLSVTKDISSKTGRNVFKFYIKRVNGNPDSSTVFSALGKYFSDEMTAKRQAVNQNFNISIDPSYPNVGNLTEMYILAKNRLNHGKNHFYPRQRVSGMTLFELWKQSKNNEPFYSGGDVLMNQIKSFLNSNPSLTSYGTIRKTIQNFYNALNKSSIKETKEQLSKLLLQKTSNSKSITEEERQLSQDIAQSFSKFFQDLTK